MSKQSNLICIHVFLVLILGATPNCIALKYSYFDKKKTNPIKGCLPIQVNLDIQRVEISHLLGHVSSLQHVGNSRLKGRHMVQGFTTSLDVATFLLLCCIAAHLAALSPHRLINRCRHQSWAMCPTLQNLQVDMICTISSQTYLQTCDPKIHRYIIRTMEDDVIM